jgi:glycine/D-amino acid oxidase-like deaminating enzyme
MNSHGVTISGATGHIIADLLAGTEPRFPTDTYATDRFGEKARNPDWLKQKISDSPSGNY